MSKTKQAKRSERAEQTILKTFEPVIQLFSEAESEALQAAKSITALEARLDQLENQRCPRCGKHTPPDGSCYFCAAEDFSGDQKQAYVRGARDLFQTLMTFSLQSENALHSAFFETMLESIWEKRLDPDRRRASEETRAFVLSECPSRKAVESTSNSDWIE